MQCPCEEQEPAPQSPTLLPASDPLECSPIVRFSMTLSVWVNAVPGALSHPETVQVVGPAGSAAVSTVVEKVPSDAGVTRASGGC